MVCDDQLRKYKVAFVGDSSVGKTSLIYSYLGQAGEPTPTVGAILTKIETKADSTPIILNVWDTAGQESLKSFIPIYARGSHAVVIVFDQSNPLSFDHVKDWYKDMTEIVGSIAFFLVANKLDLKPEVDFDQVCSWANEHNVEIVRTSAMQGFGVDTLFEMIATELRSRDEKEFTPMVAPNVNLEPQEVHPKPKKRWFRLCSDTS
jgi:small GTP-binding protein